MIDFFFFSKPGKFQKLCLSPCQILATPLLHLKMSCSTNNTQGRPQDLGGGGPRNYFFQIWEFASSEAMRILGGFGGMLPRENFLKRCNLVRFRVYFDQILSLFFSKNAIFYIKNKYFRYTFVMGYFS